MKTKFLTLFLATVLIVLTMNSCAFLRGTGSAITNNDALCLNYRNSEKSKLEVGLIHQMTNNYQVGIDTTDAQAVRFDLETLKKFIFHLEMEAKKSNVPSQDLSIRVYYARYPKKASWNDSRDLSGFLNDPITEKYEMNHTVVMIPTIKKGAVHYDFNPLDYDTYSRGFTNLTRYSAVENPFPVQQDKLSPLILGLTVTKSVTTVSQNHGNMYPPYSTDGMHFTN